MSVSNRVKETILGTWLQPIRDWGIEPVLDRTLDAVIQQYHTKTVFPPKSRIFRAFIESPYKETRIVFTGQDPYHDGSANGLCFANNPDTPLSPSLRAIKKEWEENNHDGDFDPTMLKWAHQGILMLNVALTVEQGSPKSHFDLWHNWTSVFLKKLSMARPDMLYVMFGKKSQEFKEHIVHGHVLKVVHPAAEMHSNGTANFYGSQFLNKINIQLKKLEQTEILW